MKERIARIVDRFPARVAGLAVAGVTLASAFSCGLAVRGTLADQIDLPREVAAFEARIDSLSARVDSTGERIRDLVDSQDRLTQQMRRLVCVIERERAGRSTLGCETP